MIRELEGHITNEQVNEIVNKIIEQYRSYIHLTGSNEFNGLFAKEYAPHKKQNSISWAISSAFKSETTVANMTVTCLKYGKGHTRPLLSNDFIELHILNSTSDFNANYLNQFYQKNRNNFKNDKLYCYIKFEIENNFLTNILLCLPDENGQVIAEDVLVNRTAIIRLAA